MSRIVVTWELGGGLGHIARLRPITAALADRGHEVFVVTRNVPLCNRLLARSGVTVLPAPVLPISRRRLRMPCTFSDVLHDCGFAELPNLVAVVGTWRNMFDLLQPDCLLMDHSPVALLASRGMPFVKAVIGTGFLCPPDTTPLPSLRRSRPDPPWAADVESLVLQNMNAALQPFETEPFSRVSEMYACVDRKYLLTLKELDHYSGRPDARYWRPISSVGGSIPCWPNGNGRKVFVYLKGDPTTPEIYYALAGSGYSVVCCSPGVPKAFQDKFRESTLRIEPNPLDIHAACAQSSVAVLNGGHGATCEFLLAGKPVLVLPQSLEQQVTGQRVAAAGAGLLASLRRPDRVCAAIETLMSEPSYSAAAGRISQKYRHEDESGCIRHLIDDVERTIGDSA